MRARYSRIDQVGRAGSLAALLILSVSPSRSQTPTPHPDTVGQSWTFDSQNGPYRAEIIATGVHVPFGMAFLPDGRALIGDRKGGCLSILDVTTGRLTPVAGMPAVYDSVDGGLLDIAIQPNYSVTGWIYFAYVTKGDSGSTTVVERGKLYDNRMVDRHRLFEAYPAISTENHYGSRLVLHDGYLFISLGEREVSQLAQELWTDHGKIIRLFDDGRIPPDNPFVHRAGARPEIWSYGHRNPQDLVINPTSGELWENEHGPLGGDEFNLIRPGRNYGWPIITYGREYSGAIIGDGITERQGLEQPEYHYSNSAALSGLMFYTGSAFPAWRGNAFYGAMTPQYLGRLIVTPAGRAPREERLLGEKRWRIRVVEQGLDGFLYLGVQSSPEHPDGMIVRVRPASH